MSSISFNIGRTNFFQDALERLPGVSRTALRISSDPGLTITVPNEQSRDFVDQLISDTIDGQPVQYEINPKRAPKNVVEGGTDPGKTEDITGALGKMSVSGVGAWHTPEDGFTLGLSNPAEVSLFNELLEDKIAGAPVRIHQFEVEP